MGAVRLGLHFFRRLALLIALALALFGADTALGQTPPAPVRIGVSAPAVAATAEPEKPGPGPDPEVHAPPADAPRSEQKLTIPAPPAGFNLHDGGWVRFYYEPGLRDRVQPLITQADAARADLVRRLGRPVLNKVTIYVARTPGEMAALAPEGAPFPRYASGVAYSDIGFVLLTLQPVDPNAHHDLAEVFRHELAHVALHDAVDGRPVPRWLNEGLAVFASGESSFTRVQTLWTATVSGELLPLKRLERTFPTDAAGVSVAYAQAADIVRFLIRREDHQRFVAMLERVRKGQELEAALKDSYGVDLATLEFEWREDVSRRYTFWPAVFSGSFVWVGAIGLFVWGWRRRKKRAKEVLARWEREEAMEDELRRRLEDAARQRVHIVFARDQRPEVAALKPPVEEGDVPRVEIDGRWHTLH
ncbi:MAG: peptidase MA family metallohydrolase [Polyangiaceae bacterium]